MLSLAANSYFVIHFESPTAPLRPLLEELTLDRDVIRPKLLRAEEMISRPCEHHACDFGELTPEKRTRLYRDLKQFVQKL